MSRVVVIGEALVDVINGPSGPVGRPGGSPMNVAVGLARLGTPTELVCALGSDDSGIAIRTHVEASGAAVLATAAQRTSTAVATIDAAGVATYDFDLDWRIAPIHLPAGTPVVHTGSIAAVLRPGADEVLAAVRRRPPETLFSLDPNVRPTITADRQAVLDALRPLFAEADIVKMSDEDAAWLWPGRTLDAVLDDLLAQGAALVAVMMGAAGCLVGTPAVRRTYAAAPVDVSDTIGAGDSFMSGLIVGVLEARAHPGRLDEAAVERVATLALTCAAVTVARPGADPPLRSEVAARTAPPTPSGAT